MLTIAVCQLPLNIERPCDNLDKAVSAIREAAGFGSKLIVLPELTNSGYVFADVAEVEMRATTLDGPIIQKWSELALETAAVSRVGTRRFISGTTSPTSSHPAPMNPLSSTQGSGE